MSINLITYSLISISDPHKTFYISLPFCVLWILSSLLHRMCLLNIVWKESAARQITHSAKKKKKLENRLLQSSTSIEELLFWLFLPWPEVFPYDFEANKQGRILAHILFQFLGSYKLKQRLEIIYNKLIIGNRKV
jgi:hypothetical protein